MRSTWIFYVVFPEQMQHNALAAFFISIGEILRRFMWNFFRMENEHMANAKRFIVSRDVPLPFSLPEFKLDRKATIEAESSLQDYSRVDEGRAVRGREQAGYNC
jgi:hypothetical protein